MKATKWEHYPGILSVLIILFSRCFSSGFTNSVRLPKPNLGLFLEMGSKIGIVELGFVSAIR